MHEAIEQLAQRLARRIADERAFAGHVAHALRTPLAGIDAQLAVAQRESPPALQPRLARTREAAARLSHVVTALLGLFRSGSEPSIDRVDLTALLAKLPVERVRVQVAAGAQVDADADLLAAALLNLLDNAQRHGAGHVQVDVPAEGVVRLCDDGPGVGAERRAELASALRTQDYEGHTGLGLMLADRVARAHGGSLRLPASSRGFTVELHLEAEHATPA
jgi:signal transduction histidine kinase